MLSKHSRMSIDEVNERCGVNSNNDSQVIVNINNNNTNTQSANDGVRKSNNSSQSIIWGAHEPEDFFIKFGVGIYNTSFLNEECSDCEMSAPLGLDLFSFRFYTNSLQPGSIGLHFNWAHALPGFSYELSESDGDGYSLEVYNSARYLGLEYIGGSAGGSFYPGIAFLVGTLEQSILWSECTGSVGEDDGYYSSSDTSYCDLAIDAEGTESASLSGVSFTLYSSKIASKGSGVSIGLNYLTTGDNDDVIDFSSFGVEFSSIW